MPDLLLHGGTLFTPRDRLESAWLFIQNRRIAAVGEGPPPDAPAAQRIDCAGKLIAPGFVDLHSHGAGGADLMDAAHNPDAIPTIARSLAAGGTTTFFATTVAARLAETKQVINASLPFVDTPLEGATLAGLHLEGPFLNVAQCGAHRPEHLIAPQPADYAPLLSLLQQRGRHRITAAPELKGALALGAEAHRYLLHVAIGHSDATVDDVRRAVSSGYSHVTHLYSCTSSLKNERGYKTPGIVETALLLDDLTVELIADGHHLPPDLIRLVHKVKGPDHVCLVTDSIRATGLAAGTYSLGEWEVLVEDGVAKLPDRSRFAGSVCTMARAVRIAAGAGLPLSDVFRMTSETPARLMRLPRKGALTPNYDADVVVLTDTYDVALTIAGGRIVFER